MKNPSVFMLNSGDGMNLLDTHPNHAKVLTFVRIVELDVLQTVKYLMSDSTSLSSIPA